MAGSAQTHKSISFIWIVWSTLYVYLWIYLGISTTITGKSDCPHVPQVPTALFSCARKAEKHSLSVVQMFSCPLFLCIGARRVIQEIGSWPTAYRFWWVASRNIKNPTIFNIICWVTGSLGPMTHRLSVWCSNYYFFHNFLQILCKKSFQFIFLFFYNFTKIKIKSFEP